MKLIIVESPTKAKTLSRYLGKDYEIMASMGHLRDLPKKKLGVELDNNFKPDYVQVEGKEEAISKLKKAALKSKEIILATDPDREGEAIAYHIKKILDKKLEDKVSRISFHEITKEAITKALAKPGKINRSLVDSQQARRVLDRLVGYKLSPLLWQKIRRGLSAGRVQSVAVRLIVEREKEIDKFEEKKHWQIEVLLGKTKKDSFKSLLDSKNSQKYEKSHKIDLFTGPYIYTQGTIDSLAKAKNIITDLKKQAFIVLEVKENESERQPQPPFITSTLQQSASHRFSYSAKRTMSLAQKLYEKGLITYHRTDSTVLASSALAKIRAFIKEKYGDKYLPSTSRVFKGKSKLAQEAHEAIRPTKIERSEENLKNKLGGGESNIYNLIYKRTLASQMASAKLKQSRVTVKAGPYLLKAIGVRNLFDGFLKLYPSLLKDKYLPELKEGDKLEDFQYNTLEKESQAPPRYTEASLIRILENKGIGRPSTYAPIVSVIQLRQYVEKKEAHFHPTIVGTTVNSFIVKHFEEIVEIPFTAEMEDELDDVSHGEKKWQAVIKKFYTPFAKKLVKVSKTAKREKIPTEKIGKKCPDCKKGEQVIRIGRFGKFLSCSRFPDCKWKDHYLEKIEGVKCPECGKEITIRRTRTGRRFFGCVGWPKCKWASWRKPVKTEKTST
ncbi:type I DNA topoisomerase [Candidatus Beckwithbacteria bacterium CG10_big_fil_rev_8_21_14_0_10_34_10]|uniref:DNA topoisomerase 1 n=1 Tax=Candidatus Beckwithbacteria bacterium CG10_big_fil_rev_8_21_14_0_10_34_10 TaxID=1974495 RepID=A0A2H0WBP1_9BACT|nr:MAG: type I DNA topoisomerase [Candidatus Beckwithbacteria bacterium CG10_big_fil_rev_8_21_14_0_10_34_10]